MKYGALNGATVRFAANSDSCKIREWSPASSTAAKLFRACLPGMWCYVEGLISALNTVSLECCLLPRNPSDQPRPTDTSPAQSAINHSPASFALFMALRESGWSPVRLPIPILNPGLIQTRRSRLLAALNLGQTQVRRPRLIPRAPNLNQLPGALIIPYPQKIRRQIKATRSTMTIYKPDRIHKKTEE